MTETDNLPVTPRRNYLTLLIAGIAIAALHLLHIHVPERVVIISKLLWAGIVIGISFIDSWVKFLSPVVMKYRHIGFEASRYVFAAANTAELILSIPCVAHLLQTNSISWLDLPIAVLLAQVLYLQPLLDVRSVQVTEFGIGRIKKIAPPNHASHHAYVVFEIAKIAALVYWSYIRI